MSRATSITCCSECTGMTFFAITPRSFRCAGCGTVWTDTDPRVFTEEEIVNGPDDFPYTPVKEMDDFHRLATRAPSGEIAATVTCAWCDNPVPDDVLVYDGKFCSGSCEDADRADGDNFGRDQ